ncbi:MAG: c-type cytochrome [Gemmatimonadota bacterium]
MLKQAALPLMTAAAAGCHGRPAARPDPAPAAETAGGSGMHGHGAGAMHRGMRHRMHGGAGRGMRGDSAAGSTAAAREAPACPPVSPPLVEEGKAVFSGRGNCAACHGGDARGTPLAPDLAGRVWLHGDGSYAVAAYVRSRSR